VNAGIVWGQRADRKLFAKFDVKIIRYCIGAKQRETKRIEAIPESSNWIERHNKFRTEKERTRKKEASW
jgi:hypothetical protein